MFHLNLDPLIRGLADAMGKEALQVIERDDPEERVRWNQWVLITSDPALLNDPDVTSRVTPWTRAASENIVWTDDFSNPLQVFK